MDYTVSELGMSSELSIDLKRISGSQNQWISGLLF